MKVRKFFEWLFNVGHSNGVVMSEWLTEEEQKDTEKMSESGFWMMYQEAARRKSSYDDKENFKRVLVWILVGTLVLSVYALVAFLVGSK